MKEQLMGTEMDHPLLLLGFYLNATFCEVELISDFAMGSEYRPKAEEFARRMVPKTPKRQVDHVIHVVSM